MESLESALLALSLCSAIDAELHALWRGATEMEELGASGGILEGDSKVILHWASGVTVL